MNDYNERSHWTAWTITGTLVFCMLTVLVMWGCPLWGVYEQRLDGQAKLAHAQSSKEVSVAEAKARQESAIYDKQATITAAEAVAEANKIIGNSLKNNEDYLKYLWITDTLGKNAEKQVIYVATEANIPIMEAGRTAPRKP